MKQDNWISVVHLAWKLNVMADAQPHNFSDKQDWTLNSSVFADISPQYPKLNIDLFATRLNHKLPTYCSSKPDPGCSYIDAFLITGVRIYLMHSLHSVLFDVAYRRSCMIKPREYWLQPYGQHSQGF